MKLELENVGQKVAHVGHIRRDVIFRRRIEILFGARRGRGDALILQPQLPPRRVVLGRRNLAVEDLPAPLIDQQAKGKERHFFERLVQEQPDIFRRIGRLLAEA